MRPISQWHAGGTKTPHQPIIRGITRVVTSIGTSESSFRRLRDRVLRASAAHPSTHCLGGSLFCIEESAGETGSTQLFNSAAHLN